MNPIATLSPQEDSFDFSQYMVKPAKGNEKSQPVAKPAQNSALVAPPATQQNPNLPQMAQQASQEPPPTEDMQSPEEPFDFNKYQIKQPPTRWEEFKRHSARTASRVAESVVGFPGDLVSFAKYLGDQFPDTPSWLQREPNFVQKAGRKALESLPTSSELKDFSSYLTSGFTDPQSATEELGDDVSSLATVLISPAKAVKSFPSFVKNLGSAVLKAFGVKSAGKGAELLGATPGQQTAVEVGTLFLTGLFGGKTADKFIGEQYQKARSLIPKGTMVNTTNLERELASVEAQLSRGVSTATKDEVKKSLQELKAKASGGAMEIDEIVESLHNINEKINSKKLFDELSTSERRLLKSRYDMLKDKVHEEIAAYGKHNPEFYKAWTSANEGYATIAQSKKVSNFLQSKLGKIPHHLAGSLALDLFLGKPAAVVGVGGAYTAVKAGEMMYRIAKSPTLRDHYMRVLMEAANENLPGVIKNIEALDKEFKDLEDNQGKSPQNDGKQKAR